MPTHLHKTIILTTTLLLTSCVGDTTQAPDAWKTAEPRPADVPRLVGANPHEPEQPGSVWDEVSRREGLCRVDTYQKVGVEGEMLLRISELSMFNAFGKLLKRGYYIRNSYALTNYERDVSGALRRSHTSARAEDDEALKPNRSTEYIRDARGRLNYTLELRAQEAARGDVFDHVFRYSYDAQGRIAAIERLEPMTQEMLRADFAPAQLEDESLWWVSQQRTFSYPEVPDVFERWVVERTRTSPEQPLSPDATPALDQRWSASGQVLFAHIDILRGDYTLSWSPQGQLQALTLANGDSPRYTFSYDAQGRLSEGIWWMRYENAPEDDHAIQVRVSWRDATRPEQLSITYKISGDGRDLATTQTFTGPACAFSLHDMMAHLSVVPVWSGELRLDPNTISFD